MSDSPWLPANSVALPPAPRLDRPDTVAAWGERRLAAVMAGLADTSAIIGGVSVAGAAPGSWINQAVNVPFNTPLAPGTLGAVDAFYASRGIEPLLCITPFVHTAVLAELAAAGFVLRVFEQVLAADVSQVLAQVVPPVAGLHLVPVDTARPEMVAEYVSVHLQGFYGERATPALAEAARRGMYLPGACSFLVRVAADPGDAQSGAAESGGTETVGVAAFDIYGPVGTLYGATVLEPWRRKGIQSWLIAARLAQVRAAGLSVATIASVPGNGTERNALRAGMRPCYLRMEMARPGEGLVPSP